MTAKDFLLPDLGEGLTEGEIVRWLVAVGDTIEVDQAVVEVETAKAIVEVPSPFAGSVAALHAAEGEMVEVGKPLLSVEIDGGAPAGSAPDEGEVADLLPEPAEGADDDGASGNVLVGYGTGGGTGRRRRPAKSSNLNSSAHMRAEVSNPEDGAGPVGEGGRPLAKPPVRKLAKDLGVDLRDVRPSGEGGIITRDDVRTAAGEEGDAPASRVSPERRQAPGDERVPLRGVRRRIAERMATSRNEIPEATTWVDCDATRLMELRAELNEAQPDVRVSPLALVLRIAVLGLRRFRQLNASLDGDDIVLHGAIHLGVAAQTDRGLVVPVVRDAHERSALELATELNRLAEGARAGSLSPGELTGSTFTVSNYGSFGVDGGSPVINFPEAAILGVGRIHSRPWVVDGEIAARQVVQLSIAFDHRIADGGDAAGFLRFVADRVERPSLLLADL